MSDKTLIAIGKIVAPHGVRGDVRVIPLTDFPERFQTLKKVLLEGGKELAIEAVRYHKQLVIMKFRSFDSRDAVEPLKGKLLEVTRDNVAPLPEGHFYVFDIIGLKVYDEAENYIGTVTDILHTGSNDVYVAEKEGEGERPVLIPALKEVVKTIDVAGGKMTVKLQEEWD